MSTAALQCLSSTVCVSLPEPIHPCALLPPSDPDVGVFPDLHGRIQQFKLSKPTWTDYTERCLGGGSTVAVTTDVVTTTTEAAETTSVFHTVTHTLTEAVTNVTTDHKTGAITTDTDKTIADWVIPVTVVVSLIFIIVILVIVIYKKCHPGKSFNMLMGLETIVIRKSSTKRQFNSSYHDMYEVVGPDKTAKGVNSERVIGDREAVMVKHISISVDCEASPKLDHGETSDSGISSETQISRQVSGSPAKSEEHLVEEDKLSQKPDIVILAVDNESFMEDNENPEHQTGILLKHTNTVDIQNDPQQIPISDQREQDISDTTSVEQACVNTEMKDNGGDKDKAQSESNKSDIPIIRVTSDIKNSSSSNSSNSVDLQPKGNNVDSQGSSEMDDTDDTDAQTPEHQSVNSNGLQKYPDPDSAIISHTQYDCLNDAQEKDQKFDQSSDDQLMCNGATSPGVQSDIKPWFDTNATDCKDDFNSNGGTVDLRLSNGCSDNDSIRTSGTSNSRKSDLRSDLFDIISSSLE